MARPKDPPARARLEEAVTALFCLVDDTYQRLNPERTRRYKGLKKFSDSEVLTLALFQQLCGVQSERSFLLAKTPVGLVTRIAAKVTAYTYSLYVNRLVGRPQGRIKELWA